MRSPSWIRHASAASPSAPVAVRAARAGRWRAFQLVCQCGRLVSRSGVRGAVLRWRRGGVELRLGRAGEALDRYTRDGEVVIVPAYKNGDDRAGMYFPLEYYGRSDRGAIAAWKNEMAEITWTYWLTFGGLSAAGRVSTPTLLVHSDGCVFPDHARQVHAALTGQKELVWAG